MAEIDEGQPSKEDLEKSRLYFSELEDALAHYYFLGGHAPEDFPYMPMQVFLWGRENEPSRREELKQFFHEEFGWDVKGVFTRDAHMYDLSLKDFSWSHSNNPDSFRDNTEQCFRMVNAYIQLSDYFKEHGLPTGVEDF